MYEWNEAKRLATLKERGVDFADMTRFEWATAVTRKDNRDDYGEARFMSYGRIGQRLFVCIWTPREKRIRVISLRKANTREERFYDQEKKLH